MQGHTSGLLKDNGYESLKLSGEYLFAKCSKNGPETDVGDVRVTFSYVPCGPTTVIAQQVKLADGTFSFRQWNPNN